MEEDEPLLRNSPEFIDDPYVDPDPSPINAVAKWLRIAEISVDEDDEEEVAFMGDNEPQSMNGEDEIKQKRESKRVICRILFTLLFPVAICLIIIILCIIFAIVLLAIYFTGQGFSIEYVKENTALQRMVNPITNTTGEQFLGGDGMASEEIRFIDSTHDVFLYGETLIGKMTGNKRGPFTRIHNSLGLLRKDRDEHIEFFWRNDGNISNDFFVSSNQSVYLVPKFGFQIEIESQKYYYYVISDRILRDSKETPELIDGMSIIRFTLTQENIQLPCSWWNSSSETVFPFSYSSASNPYYFTSGYYLGDEYLYLFGSKSTNQQTLLCRVSVADVLENEFQSVEFWSEKSQWKKGEISGPNKDVELVGISGLPKIRVRESRSVEYNIFIDKFFVIQKRHAQSDFSFIFSCDHITGPYSFTFFFETKFTMLHKLQPYRYDDGLYPSSFQVHKFLQVPGDESKITLTYVPTSDEDLFEYFYENVDEFFVPQFMEAKLKKKRNSIM